MLDLIIVILQVQLVLQSPLAELIKQDEATAVGVNAVEFSNWVTASTDGQTQHVKMVQSITLHALYICAAGYCKMARQWCVSQPDLINFPLLTMVG